MNLFKKYLEGKIITHYQMTHDYMQLSINENIGLNLYDGFSYDFSFKELESKKIILCEENGEVITFHLDDGSKLVVDGMLRTGPELISMYLPDGRIFVMN